MAHMVLFNKPYGVLSQFSDSDGHPGLGHHLTLPEFRVAGRLDRDSEGLLVLTDNGRVQSRITEPRFKTVKTYWVQVEGEPDWAAWRQPLRLKDGPARFLSVTPIERPAIWQRDPPIRERKSIPDCWVSVTLDEGRNRQVRRMTAALGHPTLRLVRMASGPFELDNLAPGEHRRIPMPKIYADLANQPARPKVRRPNKYAPRRVE